MATAITALLAAGAYVQKGVHRMSWSATISGVGNPLDAPNLPEKTVYVGGPSTGSGTSRVIIEGTNATPSLFDAATTVWTTLTTPTDGLLDYTGVTAGNHKVIRENPLYIRPRFETVTTGGTIVVTIISR